MAIEILTVSLSDESIEAVARRVAEIVRVDAGIDQPGVDRMVTQSNPPSSQNLQGAERSGFQQNSDPWLDSPDSQQRQAQTQGPPDRYCTHGKMRYVPAGVSASGRSYGAFYGCPLPRGDANQCKSQRVNG
jgi:hypothetical protein